MSRFWFIPGSIMILPTRKETINIMSEVLFNQALILFRGECEKWCSELLANCNDDYCLATEKLCEAMYHTFSTPPERIKKVATYLNASRIEEIISSNRKVGKYRYASSTPYNKNEVSDEWVLAKKIQGERSELTIQLCSENYIHIDSPTDSWNLIAYSYSTLENVIMGWAEGLM